MIKVVGTNLRRVLRTCCCNSILEYHREDVLTGVVEYQGRDYSYTFITCPLCSMEVKVDIFKDIITLWDEVKSNVRPNDGSSDG